MADTKFSAATAATAPAAGDLIGITQSSTDKSATFALWGGLEANAQTVTTADITGAVGQMYVCTIAGLTASRSLTLPSAQVGERLGVYIVDGDASFELILKGAASQQINGGTATAEWSRLFIKGECVIFRCIAANSWIVEHDGRIPCFLKIEKRTAQTPTAATWTAIEFTNIVDSAGIVGATSTPWKQTIRRAGVYSCDTMLSRESGTGTGIQSLLLNSETSPNSTFTSTYSSIGGAHSWSHSIAFSFATGDQIRLAIYNSDTVATRASGQFNYPALTISEVL